MDDITKIAVADEPVTISFSVYFLLDTSNVQISWDIGGSADNIGNFLKHFFIITNLS